MERGLICILNNYIDLLDRLILISSTVNRKHQVRCLSFNVEAVSCNTQLEFQHTGIISVNAFELTSGTCNKLVPAYIYIYIYSFSVRASIQTGAGITKHAWRFAEILIISQFLMEPPGIAASDTTRIISDLFLRNTKWTNESLVKLINKRTAPPPPPPRRWFCCCPPRP